MIRSSSSPAGSDLFLVANDGIVLEIGDVASQAGTFEVWNKEDTDKLLILDENGDLDLKGTVGMISDINQKEDIIPVNQNEILQKLIDIPIMEWQYLGNESRHIGPMAQDFYAAFGLGKGDTRITTIDADGVALAAIQALAIENEELKKLIVQMQNRISLLEENSPR